MDDKIYTHADMVRLGDEAREQGREESRGTIDKYRDAVSQLKASSFMREEYRVVSPSDFQQLINLAFGRDAGGK